MSFQDVLRLQRGGQRWTADLLIRVAQAVHNRRRELDPSVPCYADADDEVRKLSVALASTAITEVFTVMTEAIQRDIPTAAGSAMQ